MILASFFFASCGEEASTADSGSVGIPDDGSGTTPDLDPAPPPRPLPSVGDSSSGMYVRIFEHTNGILQHISQKGVHGSTCEISKDTVNSHMICDIDMAELDFAYHGLVMHYNIPPSMCDFVEMRNYWFYSWEVGRCPTDVTFTRVYLNNQFESGTCTADSVSCVNHPELRNYDAASASVECIYDHSPSKGPNCVLGNTTFNVTDRYDTQVDANPRVTGTDVVTSQQVAWSDPDNRSLCFGGPGIWDSDWPKNELNFPINKISWIEDSGVNSTYALPGSNISGVSVNSMYSSNSYTYGGGASAHHYQTNVGATESTELPHLIYPLQDRQGDLSYLRTQDAYEFRCLDHAGEVLNSIKVYVREWNRYSDFVAWITDGNASATPNYTSSLDCEYVSSEECNDYYDLDDFRVGSNKYYPSTKPDSFGYSSESLFTGAPTPEPTPEPELTE